MATAGADIVARMILQTGNVTSGVASMSSKLRAEAEGIAASNAKIGSSAKKAANEVNQSSLAANKMSYNWGTMFRGAEGSMSGFFGRMDSGTTKLSLLERTTSRVSGVMGTLKSKVAGAATAIGSMDMMSSMLLAGAGLGILAFFAKATQAAGDFEDQWTTFGITMGKTGSDTSSIMSQWGSTYQSIQDTTGRSQTDIMSGLDKLSIAGVKSTGLMTRSMDDLGGAAFQTHNSMGTLEDAFQRNVQSTGLQQRSLKALGINMADLSHVSGKSASDITKQWKTMTASQKAALLDQAMEYKDGKSANEKFKESYQGLLQGAKNAFQGIEIAVGNTILPILVPALKTAAAWATNFAKEFSKAPGPIKDIVVAIGVLTGGLLALGGMAAILKPIITPLKAIGSAIQSVGGFVKTAIIKIGEYIASLDLIPKIKGTTIYQKVVTQGGSPVTPTSGGWLSNLGNVILNNAPSEAVAGYMGVKYMQGAGAKLTSGLLGIGGLASRGLNGLAKFGLGDIPLGLDLPGNPLSNLENGQPLVDTGQLKIAGGNLYNSIAGQFNPNTPGSAASQVGVFNKDWGNVVGHASGFQNYLKGGVDNAKNYLSGAYGNTESWLSGAGANTGKALSGVGSWISGGFGSMFGGASAADGKSKPSMMSDIFGKNGLLDFSRFGVKWPKFKLPDLSGLWASVSGDASGAFDTIEGAWNNTTKWFSNGVKTVESDFKGAGSYIEGAWDNTVKDLSNGVKNIEKWFGSAWKDIQMGWNTLTKSIHNVWTSLISTLKNGANVLKTDVEVAWKDIQNAFYSAVKGITNAWNTLKHLIDMGVSGVIHVGASAITNAYNGALRLYNYIRNGVTGAIRIGTGALYTVYNDAKRVWDSIRSWFSGVLHLNISGPGSGGGIISRIENDAMGVFNTIQSNPVVQKLESGAKWVVSHILGPKKEVRGVVNHRSKIDLLKEKMAGFGYQDYANHKKSIGQVLKDKAGNCFDLTLAGIAVGNAIGLPSYMKLGTWNGGGHAYGNFDGENLDFARKALDNTYTPPPRGPGSQGNDSSKQIIVQNIFKGPVYGLPDFEDQVEDKTVKALNKHLGGIL